MIEIELIKNNFLINYIDILNIPINTFDSVNISFDKLHNNDIIYYISLACDNYYVINQQIRLINKYIKDNYLYIIFDNSKDDQISNNIKKLCVDTCTSYVRLPKCFNKVYLDTPSINNGVALSYIYYNFILLKKPKYFGFIHHDVFPIKEVNMKQIIEYKDFYGVYLWSIPNNIAWSLHPCFCFFKTDFLVNKPVSFLPRYKVMSYAPPYLDTGGENWNFIFNGMNYNTHIDGPKLSKKVYDTLIEESILKQLNKKKKKFAGGTIDGTYFIYNNNWIHTCNASNWFEKSLGISIYQKKTLEIIKLLDSY